MASLRSSIGVLLTTVFVLFAGNSLLNTLVPLRATLENFPPIVVGILGSAYYAGMLAGALAAPAIIARVGFIRAFAAFAAVAIACALTYSLAVTPLVWVGLRILMGCAFAGIYGVTDSWANAKSSNSNRGHVYALYQIMSFAGSSIGQQISGRGPPRGFELFSLGAILIALSIVPMATTKTEAPERPRTMRLRLRWLLRLSPVGVATAVVVGAANGTFFSLAPVYALDHGGSPAAASTFMAATVVGSAAMVWPAGRLSDKVDRRLLIAAYALAGVVCELVLWQDLAPARAQALMGFCVGATTMVLYTLGSSHANDRGGTDHAVEVSTGLLFLYCAGAITAPTIASAMMERFGTAALFEHNAVLHLALAAFVMWCIFARKSGRSSQTTERERLAGVKERAGPPLL